MHSLKAFIRENHCQKIAPCSTAIFPYFTALTERKLLLRLTGCHIKRDVFTDPLFGQDFSPYSCRGWEAIAAEFTALDFQRSAANILTKRSNKIPAGFVGCDKTQDGTDPPWEIYSPIFPRARTLHRGGSRNPPLKPCLAAESSVVPGG